MTKQGLTPSSKEHAARPVRTSRYRGRFKPKSRYQFVTDRERCHLIDLVEAKSMTVKSAAKIAKIPYENAKAIVRVYRKEGRRKRLFEYSEGSEASDLEHGYQKCAASTHQPTSAQIKQNDLYQSLIG